MSNDKPQTHKVIRHSGGQETYVLTVMLSVNEGEDGDVRATAALRDHNGHVVYSVALSPLELEQVLPPVAFGRLKGRLWNDVQAKQVDVPIPTREPPA